LPENVSPKNNFVESWRKTPRPTSNLAFISSIIQLESGQLPGLAAAGFFIYIPGGFAPSLPPMKNPSSPVRSGARRGVLACAACSLALLLGSGSFSLGQTPTPTPPPPEEPVPMPPTPEALPDAYQPKAYSSDVTILRRLRFLPNPAVWGNGPYPVALTLFAGGFKDGDIYGSQGQRWADNDLAKQGFLVFSIDYRLAPPGLILQQHIHDTTPEGIASGRPPQQTNDVKQADSRRLLRQPM
jgi:hypothetical protein